MNLLLTIDHFGSGGAQRQIVTLAKGLVRQGHHVDFFIYYPEFKHFRAEVEKAGIPIYEAPKKKKGFSSKVMLALRKKLKTGKYQAVISFLDTPNIYAELAGIGLKNVKIIVSERNSYLKETSKITSLAKRITHSLADVIIANSTSQAEWLKKTYPWLKHKTLTIYNGYDLNEFTIQAIPELQHKNLKLLGIGRITYQKNQYNFIKALDLFYQENGWCPEINWVGDLQASAEGLYKKKIDTLLDTLPHVKTNWKWLGERNDIPQLLAEHHALISPSYFEGFPNVVCEALLSGRPVLTTDVCDNGYLVKDGARGFLFHPHNPDQISQALKKLATLDKTSLTTLSANSREFAMNNLGQERYVGMYASLL
ncbi:MAG: glycosyltransferase [Balneolales bacterium]